MNLSVPTSLHLPDAPSSLLDANGLPRYGRYAGALAQFDWQDLAAPLQRNSLWRRLHHKRWRYLSLATDEIFCGIAMVDLGWASSSFAYVFDRASRREIASFSQDGLPLLHCRVSNQPFLGADCRFSAMGKHILFRHLPGREHYQFQLRAGQLQIEAEVDQSDAGPALLALGQVVGGTVHATQKSAAMRVQGSVTVGEKRFDLTGGIASMDYSSGFLGRDTAWHWACAQSEQIGFNLQQGYFGAQENALWLGGKLYPLGAAQFRFDKAQPHAPWDITTDDGLLQLRFTPAGVRAQDKNLVVAISRYIQPIGNFSGWVKPHAGAEPVPVRDLLGVTEDHFSRW